MKYNLYFYDGSKNAVVMTDMEGKELVVECDRAEANVVFDVLEDRGYLVRLAMQEPASYIADCNESEWLTGLCGCNVFN